MKKWLALSVMLYIFFNAEKPWLSVFCFMTFGLFFNSMNFMRQMIAACILLLAMRFIRKKQLLPYLIVVVFASTFHISALLMIPFYFILRLKLTGRLLIVYSFVTVLLFAFSKTILDCFNNYIYKDYTNYMLLSCISASASCMNKLPVFCHTIHAQANLYE